MGKKEKGLGEDSVISSGSSILKEEPSFMDKVFTEASNLGSTFKSLTFDDFYEANKAMNPAHIIYDSSDEYIDNNKNYQKAIDEEKKKGTLNNEKAEEIKKKFDETSSTIGAVTTFVTKWDNSEDNYNKVDFDVIDNNLKDAGFTSSAFTNFGSDIFRHGSGQNQTTIEGSIKAEDEYLRILTEKTDLTYTELQEYEGMSTFINDPKSQDMIDIVNGKYTDKNIEGYSQMVDKFGMVEANRRVREVYKENIIAVEDMLSKYNATKDKINGLNDSFEVNLAGIGSNIVFDSSDTYLTGLELYNKQKRLKEANDKNIKAATGLDRNEYNKQLDETNKEQNNWSIDDIYKNSLRETQEYKDEMKLYEGLTPNDRQAKGNSIIARMTTEGTLKDQMDGLEGKNKWEVQSVIDKNKEAHTSLNKLGDKFLERLNNAYLKNTYPKLNDSEIRDKIFTQLIDSIPREEMLVYEEHLRSLDTASAKGSLYKGSYKTTHGLKELDIGEIAGGILHTTIGLGQSALGEGGHFAEETYYGMKIINYDYQEKLKSDLFSHFSGVRNVNSGIAKTLWDTFLYDKNAYVTAGLGFLPIPGVQGKLAAGSLTAIGKLNKYNNILNNFEKGLEAGSKYKGIIEKIKLGSKLTKVEKELLLKNKDLTDTVRTIQEIKDSKGYATELSRIKALEKGQETDSIIERIKFFNETNATMKKTTNTAGFLAESAVINMRMDVGLDQAMNQTLSDDLLMENFLFNILGDSVLGTVMLSLGQKYFQHGVDVTDIAKKFDTNEDLLEGVNEVRRLAMHTNGGALISKTDALNMIQSSMKALGSHSSKYGAKLDTVDEILDYTKKALAYNPKKGYNVTDDGKIISFNDNISKLASQETRLSELEKLYNKALNTNNKKRITYYKTKLERELDLVSSLTVDLNKKDMKDYMKNFQQNKGSYLGSDLTVKNKNIRLEINKKINSDVADLRAKLNSDKKINSKKMTDNLKDVITEYDEASKGGRMMRVYDPYTQKEILINGKMLKVQAEALAVEKGISVREAEKLILSTGGMSINIDMKFADIVDGQGGYQRVYGFSETGLRENIDRLGLTLGAAKISDVGNLTKVNKFLYQNKNAIEMNKALSETIKISDHASKGFAVSFNVGHFGKNNVDKYLNNYKNPDDVLSFKNSIGGLNKTLGSIIKGLHIDEVEFSQNISSNLYKIFNSNISLGTYDARKLLEKNINFKNLSNDEKYDVVNKINEKISEVEVKYYNAVIKGELGDKILDSKVVEIGNGYQSTEKILKKATSNKSVLSLVSGSLFDSKNLLKDETKYWNKLIYILPGGKVKGTKEYKTFNDITASHIADKKIKQNRELIPMKEYASVIVKDLLRLKSIKGEAKGLETYLEIISESVAFNLDDYIKGFYKKDTNGNLLKEDKEEYKDITNTLKFLNDNILTKGDAINEAIQKNFVHNYILNKEEVDVFLKNFKKTDSQALILRNLLMSETSFLGIVNKETDKVLDSKKLTHSQNKIKNIIKENYHREKDIFEKTIARGQEEIDLIKKQIKDGHNGERKLERYELIQLSDDLNLLIKNQIKKKFMTYEVYETRNIGIAMYQDVFNGIKTKLVKYTNTFIDGGIEKNKKIIKDLKININKFSTEDKERIYDEILKYSELNKKVVDDLTEEGLDITKEIELLRLKKSKLNSALGSNKQHLKNLKDNLGSKIPKEDKQLAMADYIRTREEELVSLNKLLEEIENIVPLDKPKAPKGKEGISVIKPDSISLDIKASDLLKLKKDIKSTIKEIEDITLTINDISKTLSSHGAEKIIKKVEQLDKSIKDSENTSYLFNNFYRAISKNIEAGGDITTLRLLPSDKGVINYQLSGKDFSVGIEGLSEGQAEVLTDVLRNIEKDRNGITGLNLNVQDIVDAKYFTHTEDEIGEVIYKDLSDSIFLDYDIKDEHNLIFKNFDNKYITKGNKEYKGRKLISKLYNTKSSKFRKKIDEFYIEDLSDIKDINKSFREFAKELYKGVEYKYRANDGVEHIISGDELLKKIDLDKLRNRFISLRYEDTADNIVNMSSEISEKGYPIYKSGTSQYVETSVVYKNIKKGLGKNIRYLTGQSEKKLIQLLKTHKAFTYMPKEEIDLLGISPLGIINGSTLRESYTVGKETFSGVGLMKHYRDILGLEKGEILTLGFGDKDGFSMIYKSPIKFSDESKDKISFDEIARRSDINQLVYFYDLAIASGFIKVSDVKAKKIWNAFLKDVDKSLPFEDFKRALFTYKDKDGNKLVDITVGGKKYPDDHKNLLNDEAGRTVDEIQGSRIFKTSSDDIRKRIGSSASSRNLFQGLKGEPAKYEGDLDKYLSSKGHKSLILKKKIDNKLKGIFDTLDTNEEKVDAFIKYAKDNEINIKGIIDKPNDITLEPASNKEILVRIKAIYLDDLDDGTGFITKDIGQINSKINGGSETVIKAHIQGFNTDGQINLGKGQLNAAKVKYKGKEIENTLLMGDGMHKINGGAKEIGTGKVVTIRQFDQDVEYEIMKVDDNIDYSYYKEATSTKDSTTKDVSINNLLSLYNYRYGDLLDKKVKGKIETLIKDFSRKYLIDDDLRDIYGDVNVLTRKLLKTREEIKYSDQHFNQKFNILFEELQGIIDEVRTGGYGYKAFKARSDIHPDVVMMSSNSKLAKQLKKDFKEGENMYVVTTRYPISDAFVTGVYRVKFDDTLDPKHMVVHPENAFYKLRADFDGDTITTYSIKDEYGEIAAKASLGFGNGYSHDYKLSGGKKLIDSNGDDLAKHMDDNFEQTETGNRINDYIQAEEVKSADTDTYRSFVNNTFIAQQAKNGISIGASTVRTASIVQNAIERLKDAKNIDDANTILSGYNHFTQQVILNGVLGKGLREIDILDSKLSKNKEVVLKANQDGYKGGVIQGKNRKEYSIKDIYDSLPHPIEVQGDQFAKTKTSFLSYLNKNLKHFNTENGVYQIDLDLLYANERVFDKIRLTEDDMLKLGNVKQDREFHMITGKVLNTFLDFGKSGKEQIDFDFDRGMINSMYRGFDYDNLTGILSHLGMNNKPDWDNLHITSYDFSQKLNDTVSGASLGLWNHAHDLLKPYIELRQSSYELPFLLEEYRRLLPDHLKKELDSKLYQLALEDPKLKGVSLLDARKEIATKYDSISDLLLDYTGGDYVRSTTFLTRKQKEELLKFIEPNLNQELLGLLHKIEGEIIIRGDGVGYKGDLDKYVGDFFNKVEEIKNVKQGEGGVDKITTVLLSKVLSKETQKILKEFNVNNLSIQNTMSDGMIAGYLNETIKRKQLFIHNEFKNLDIDTKEEYLESIKGMVDRLDDNIASKKDKILSIKDSFNGQYITIAEKHLVKKAELEKLGDKIMNQSVELESMNKTKKAYFTKKKKYNEELKKYNNDLKQLDIENIKLQKQVDDYKNKLIEYSLFIENRNRVRKEIKANLNINIAGQSNSDLITHLNNRLESIGEDIVKYDDEVLFDIKESQNLLKLNEEGDKYIVKIGKDEIEYNRVSLYTSKPIETTEPDLLEYSSQIGSDAELLIRDIFDGKKKSFLIKDYGTLNHFLDNGNIEGLNSFKAFINDIKLLKKDIKDRGETIYAKDIKLKDDNLGLGGEVNLITKTKDGKYKMYDIKTIRDNQYYNWKLNGLDDTKGNQLSMYAHMIDNNYKIKGKNIEIDEIEVLVFKANYNYGQEVIAEGVLSKLDNSIKSIEYAERVKLRKRRNLSEINEDLIRQKIRTPEDIINPYETFVDNIKRLKKEIQAVDKEKASIYARDKNKSLEYSKELDEINELDIFESSEEIKKIGEHIGKDLSELDSESLIGYFSKDIDELVEQKKFVERIEKRIDEVTAIKTNLKEVNDMHKEKVTEFKNLSLPVEGEVKLDIKDLYVGWDKEMSNEVYKDLKGVLDTFRNDWKFQFVDELQDKDPEFLDRINTISHHLGADFNKLNDETIEWANILSSLKGTLKDKKLKSIEGLSDDKFKELDEVHKTFGKKLKSLINFGRPDEVHRVGRTIKEAINSSFMTDGGVIELSIDLLNANFKKRIVAQGEKKVSYDGLDDRSKALVDKEFPNLLDGELQVGHLNYLYLMSNQDLQYHIQKYLKGTVAYATNKLNGLDDAVGIDLDLLNKYAKDRVHNDKLTKRGELTHSSLLIDDVMEGMKGNHNIAIISLGLDKKVKFMERLEGKGFSTKNANILYNELYKKELDGGQGFFDFMNMVNYHMKYGLGNIFHRAGSIAATIQMPGQWTEIQTRKASFGGISDRDVDIMINNYKILGGEDTNVFSSGIGLQNQNNMFSGLLVDTISNAGYKIDERVGKVFRSTLDYATSPLGKHDAPFDTIRKEAAVKQAMHELGYKTYEDFVLSVNQFGKGELNRFETRARMIYNELGGGVSSKDSLYKINKLFNVSGYAQIDNRAGYIGFALRAWQNLGGYLAHWMANKSMRQIEIYTNLGRAVVKGDWKAANELGKAGLSRARNIAYLTIMGLKFDKYQTIDTEKKDGPYTLVKALANDIVSIGGAVGFAINAHERAMLADAGMSEYSIMMLQAITARFTGSLNSVPNLTNSLYSKLANRNFENMNEGEMFGFIFGSVLDSIRDNGGNFNRYSGVNASEYGTANVGISFSSMTGQGVGGTDGEINRLGFNAYLTDKEINAIRNGGFEEYFLYGTKSLIGEKWFRSGFGINSTELNRTAQTARMFLKSSETLMDIDRVFHDKDASMDSIFELLTGDRYTMKGDMITQRYSGKKFNIHRNELILLDQIQGYYRSNGSASLYKYNQKGEKIDTYTQAAQVKKSIMKDEFGDLGVEYTGYAEDGGTLNYQSWLEERIAGFINPKEGVKEKHNITVSELNDFIIDKEVKDRSIQLLKDTYGSKYFQKGKGFDDIKQAESDIIYLEVLKEYKGLLSMDRGLKQVIDKTALYLDNDLQQHIYKETGNYLPLFYNEKEEKGEISAGDQSRLQPEMLKYEQPKKNREIGDKIMTRLTGYVKEDDFAKKLIKDGKEGTVHQSLKVMTTMIKDPSILSKTLDKVKPLVSDEEFKDIGLMVLDTMNPELAKNSEGSKLAQDLKDMGAVEDYVNYYYAMTEAAKDYDPEAGDKDSGLRSSFNGFSRYTGKQQGYTGGYGTGQGGSEGYAPITKFINQNRDLLKDNPHRYVQDVLGQLPFRPTYGTNKILDYVLPRLTEVRVGGSKDVIKETGRSNTQGSVTYKKIANTKKIKVRQSKVQSKIKSKRTTSNLLSGMTYGEQRG